MAVSRTVNYTFPEAKLAAALLTSCLAKAVKPFQSTVAKQMQSVYVTAVTRSHRTKIKPKQQYKNKSRTIFYFQFDSA